MTTLRLDQRPGLPDPVRELLAGVEVDEAHAGRMIVAAQDVVIERLGAERAEMAGDAAERRVMNPIVAPASLDEAVGIRRLWSALLADLATEDSGFSFAAANQAAAASFPLARRLVLEAIKTMECHG